LFYDAKVKGYTTSTYYAPELPAWVRAFQAAHPIDALLGPREPDRPDLLARFIGPDDGPGEGDPGGFARTFPHLPAKAPHPYETFSITPASVDLLADLALEGARQLDLGGDDVPDLLLVSVSTTDYAAHGFGSESWEAVDVLRRADLAIGRLWRALEARAPTALLVTADHGSTPLVETSRAAGHDAVRFASDEVVATAERAIAAKLGPGRYVHGFQHPFLFLTPSAKAPEVRAAVMAAALPALRAIPGVEDAFDTAEARGWTRDADPIKRALGLAVAPNDGEIFVYPRRYSSLSEDLPNGGGTSHGSPWDYDREVPVLFAGAGVVHVESREVHSTRRVASTLAALLGTRPPRAAEGAPPLPGLCGR
jgi:hypothetical protein